MNFAAYVGPSINQKSTNETVSRLTELTFNADPYKQLRSPGVMLTTPLPYHETADWHTFSEDVFTRTEAAFKAFEDHLKTMDWGSKQAVTMHLSKDQLIIFNGDRTDQSIHVIDMRPTQGHIWVTSSAQLWRDTVNNTPSLKELVPEDQVIIEFPPQQIWLMRHKPDEAQPWEIVKFKINRRALLKGLECQIV